MKLDSTIFTHPGFETSDGEWPEETVAELITLRQNHPELSGWGLLAVGNAWGDFSEDVLSLGWCYWLIGARCEMFLDYCCWRQTRGKWDGQYDEELLSEANEWRS